MTRIHSPNAARGQLASSQSSSKIENHYSNLLIKPDDVVIEPCSVQYLSTLCVELFRAVAQPYVSTVKATSADDDENRLEMVTYEIERLCKHPLLFPTESTRVKFLALLALDSQLQFQEACSGLLIEAEIQELDAVRQQDCSRPLYLPGTKGWENFLLNMAPGAPEDPSNRSITTPKSAFQMIPAVGVKIIADFEREEQDIVRYIEQSPSTYGVEPARSTLMIDFDKPTPWEERIPRRALKRHNERVMISPNPFKAGRSIRDDITKNRVCDIESLSGFLHDIEAPQAAPVTLTSADSLPAITIREWHAPTKFKKLRFGHVEVTAQ